MDIKIYGAYRKGIAEKNNIKEIVTNKEDAICSLLISLLNTKKIFLSKEFFEKLKKDFKKVERKDLNENCKVVILSNADYANNLRIDLRTYDERYFVRFVKSDGLNFLGVIDSEEEIELK